MELISLAKIKNSLNIIDDSFDEILTDISEGVYSFIEGVLDVKLKYNRFSEISSGDGYNLIIKNNLLLNSNSRVTIEVFDEIKKRWEVVNGTWRISSSGVVNYKTPRGFQNVKIVYYSGFQNSRYINNLPSDISELARRLIIRKYRKLNFEGEKTTSFENSSLTWSELLEKDDEMVLERYKRKIIF